MSHEERVENRQHVSSDEAAPREEATATDGPTTGTQRPIPKGQYRPPSLVHPWQRTPSKEEAQRASEAGRKVLADHDARMAAAETSARQSAAAKEEPQTQPPEMIPWEEAIEELSRAAASPDRQLTLMQDLWKQALSRQAPVADRLYSANPRIYNVAAIGFCQSSGLFRAIATLPPAVTVLVLDLLRPTLREELRLETPADDVELAEVLSMMAQHGVVPADPLLQGGARSASTKGQWEALRRVQARWDALRARARAPRPAPPPDPARPWDSWLALPSPPVVTGKECVVLAAGRVAERLSRLRPGEREALNLPAPVGLTLPFALSRSGGDGPPSGFDLHYSLTIHGDPVSASSRFTLGYRELSEVWLLRCPRCKREWAELYLPPPRVEFRCASCVSEPRR